MPQFTLDNRLHRFDFEQSTHEFTCSRGDVSTVAIHEESIVPSRSSNSYMLWIDGVGAWQLCSGSSFSIGAPTFESESADIAILANISRRHAELQYQADHWQVAASQMTSISGRPVETVAAIRSGDQLCLANRVQLGFRVPSVLSASAVIDFESNHRPTRTVDGIILMVDHCLLGPRRDHHIYCPDWPQVVILYFNDGYLKCRSSNSLQVNGESVAESAILQHGSVVSGDDLRFRIEEIR